MRFDLSTPCLLHLVLIQSLKPSTMLTLTPSHPYPRNVIVLSVLGTLGDLFPLANLKKVFPVSGWPKLSMPGRPENFYGILKIPVACVNCKCMCYTALIFYPDFLYRLKEKTIVLKIGALKI